MSFADTIIVLDFETTGLSPDLGDRAIEIGAVRIDRGKLVDRFQKLMNPGRPVSRFIEDYTGISNSMLQEAESNADVMRQFSDFVGDSNMVAHNAAFDRRFLDAEYARISQSYSGEFTCSLLATRRIFQNSPDHKLATLVKHIQIEADGTFHRALYDSLMTAKVWNAMLAHIRDQYGIRDIPFSLIQRLNKTPKKSVRHFLTKESSDIKTTQTLNIEKIGYQ